MQGQPGVRSLLNEKDLIDRLFAVLDGLRNAAFAVALVQAVGAILLIANMVQVAAHTRRTEIGIMRLVGASRWYTSCRSWWRRCWPRPSVWPSRWSA